jgi:hypothetical protein
MDPAHVLVFILTVVTFGLLFGVELNSRRKKARLHKLLDEPKEPS